MHFLGKKVFQLSTMLKYLDQAPDQVEITNCHTFLNFLVYHKTKRIVLVIDEFNHLLANKNAKVELFNVLRTIKVL
jgi:hypothetical protein